MILKIGLVVYSVLAVIFLVFALLDNKKVIKIMKPFMELVLMIFAILYMKQRNIVNIYIILALSFILISNILMIKSKNTVFFILGTIASLTGVVFYIIRLIKWLPFELKWYFYTILIILFIVWFLLFYGKIKQILNKLTLFYTFYSYILVCGISISMIVVLVELTIFSIALVAGFICLVFSDCVIFVLLFNKNVKRISLYTTIPYCFAQMCILVGCVFI